MKQFKRAKLGILLGLVSLSAPGFASANQSAGAKAEVPPQAMENIPQGRLKQSLSALPEPAQQRVLQRLANLGIPAVDLLLMDVDKQGELFYVEEGLVEFTEPAANEPTTATALSTSDVLALHSNPGAANTIYLDFDGGQISGRAWGGGASYSAVPYDLDGDPQSFSDAERSRIHEIWTRVAEDYAAFDVDVTTEAPASFGPDTGWLLFTKDTDANGTAMPSQGAGGVAYVGVWGRSNYTYYQPALVYYNRLGNGAASYMAEAGSHEMGHNFGLSHDGTSSDSYYSGLGADDEPSSWAPIMGVGYYKNLTQWSRGDYSGANQTQDDIAIIANQLGASDDVKGSESNPASLTIDGSGQITSTNREVDPGNANTDNQGIISVGDSDWFQFMAGTGALELTATPAWDAFTRSRRRGANLDIGLRLYDAQGALVADSADSVETSTRISTSVAEGMYTLEVYGTGGNYTTAYGSQGYYYLNGQVALGVADTTPPDPNPMSFAQTPIALSDSDVEMQAVIATDDREGAVSYQFVCTLGDSACADSEWQSERQYTATGLSPETQYCFTVRARDLSGNTTVASTQQCAMTQAAPLQPEPPQAPSSLMAVDGQNGTAELSWTDASDNETAFDVQREQQHKNGRWQSLQVVATVGADVQSYVDSSGEGTFRYRVRATNAQGNSAWTDWSLVAITAADGGDNGNGGGNDKPCRGNKCK